MKKYFPMLRNTPLFQGKTDEELELLLSCLGARVAAYEKGQTVFFTGEPLEHFALVLSGQLQVVQDDYYGNRNILTLVEPGYLVGESFAFAKSGALPVSVIAAVPSELLLIHRDRVASPCSHACSYHRDLIQAMLSVLSMKNIALTEKIEFITKRTTREKLLAYLFHQSRRAGSKRFTIPFDRRELAEYLSVDRSAMSTELSKLKKEGILDFHKNQFELF